MTWGEWTAICGVSILVVACVGGLAAAAEAIGGWGYALNAIPYVALFFGLGWAVTR